MVVSHHCTLLDLDYQYYWDKCRLPCMMACLIVVTEVVLVQLIRQERSSDDVRPGTRDDELMNHTFRESDSEHVETPTKGTVYTQSSTTWTALHTYYVRRSAPNKHAVPRAAR